MSIIQGSQVFRSLVTRPIPHGNKSDSACVGNWLTEAHSFHGSNRTTLIMMNCYQIANDKQPAAHVNELQLSLKPVLSLILLWLSRWVDSWGTFARDGGLGEAFWEDICWTCKTANLHAEPFVSEYMSLQSLKDVLKCWKGIDSVHLKPQQSLWPAAIRGNTEFTRFYGGCQAQRKGHWRVCEGEGGTVVLRGLDVYLTSDWMRHSCLWLTSQLQYRKFPTEPFIPNSALLSLLKRFCVSLFHADEYAKLQSVTANGE